MIEREHGLTEEGLARRRFLKQAGTVAWASPLIVTMLSRTAYAAPKNCGTKTGGPGTVACAVTNPCGSVGLTCLGNPNAAAGSTCSCEEL